MPDQQPDPAGGSWHLDRRVPIALILTIIVQTVTIAWWASDLSARVAHLERTETVRAPQGDRLTRVEVKLENLQLGIEEIKRLLRRPGPPPAQ